jgi:hypothetical protein
MSEGSESVRVVEDRCIRIPAKNESGSSEPLELRPGSTKARVAITQFGALAVETDLVKLRQGLRMIEEEHGR